jgi:hypothetical protein
VLSWVQGKRAARLRTLVILDLLTGALVATVLALVLQPVVLTGLSWLLKVQVTISACTLSLPGTCAPTLSQLDWVIAGSSLALGLLVLVISLLLRGVTRLRNGAVAAAQPKERLTLGDLVPMVCSDRGGLRAGALQLLGGLISQLRPFLWPLLLLAGSISLASSARAIQVHLHANDALLATDLRQTAINIVLNLLVNALPGLIEGPVGFTFFIAAVGVLLLSGRVVAGTREFIAFANMQWRLLAWLCFLPLFVLNRLGLWLRVTQHHPFDALSLTALTSFVLFLAFTVRSLGVRRQAAPRE